MDLLSFVAFAQLVGEETEFTESQVVALLETTSASVRLIFGSGGLRMIRRSAIDGGGGRHGGRIRWDDRCLRLRELAMRLLLLLLWYLHQFALSGAMDHLQNLRLRWINAGLVEERLQPLGFTDNGAAVRHHAAPYLVQFSVKQQQQGRKTIK